MKHSLTDLSDLSSKIKHMPICNQSQHGSLLIIELLASKSTYIECIVKVESLCVEILVKMSTNC